MTQERQGALIALGLLAVVVLGLVIYGVMQHRQEDEWDRLRDDMTELDEAYCLPSETGC